MKILYLSPVGKKVLLTSAATVDDHKIVDLDPVRLEIINRLRQQFPSYSITHVKDAISSPAEITNENLQPYDAFVCDLTTANANILFSAGIAEATSKPIIYIISSYAPSLAIAESRRVLSYTTPTISEEFYSSLFSLVTLAAQNPRALTHRERKPKSSKAFISYSHQDKGYLDRLMVHLKPMVKAGLIDPWVDTRIKAGDNWKEAIQGALDNSNIAILLVSADFLASDFIVDNELPPLLARAEVKGTRIIPLILSPCRFSRDKNLNRYQSVNAPNRPLSAMNHDEREAVYDQLVSDVEKALQTSE